MCNILSKDILKRRRAQKEDADVWMVKGTVREDEYLKVTATGRKPTEQREQKPNLFGLCRVATEDDDSQYGIQSVPTLMLFRQGEVQWRTSGVMQKSELLATIDPFLK